MRERFPLTVNDKLIEIDDPIVDGRDIRGAAGFDPPSDYVLVLMGHRSAQSVGLDARLDLRELDKPSFRAWESDRLFEFTVNEHGFEWGIDHVSEEEVRRYADIDEDHELVLDADHDSVIPAGGSIDVSTKGVEHIVSRQRRPFGVIHLTFVVNGHPHEVAGAPSDTLLAVLEEALKQGENVGQAADCWEVRTEDGTQLDVGATLGALGLVDGTVLLANLTREYHDNPGHTGDAWLLHRDKGDGRLFRILDVIWRYGTSQLDGMGFALVLQQSDYPR